MINKRYLPIFIIMAVVLSGLFIYGYKRGKDGNQVPANIILIIVDALRPDHLSCYGYKRNTSPNIDQLAEEGVRFSQVISPGGHTVTAVPSILTGTYSPTHQIKNWNDLMNSAIKTIVQELNSKNYQCVFWSNYASLKHMDIKNGFHRIVLRQFCIRDIPRITDSMITDEIIVALEKQSKHLPFFWYIHYGGTHAPYRPPSPYKEMYLEDEYRKKPEVVPLSNYRKSLDRYFGYAGIPYVVIEKNITDPNYYVSQYDGVISYVDVQIGRLIKRLKELNLDKNTVIIFTADHGEMLGEHNIYFCHEGGYEENIRVPLIIRLPGLFPQGEVIPRQISSIDLAPTILEIAGLEKPSYMQGNSLLPLLGVFRIYPTKYVLSFCDDAFILRSEKWKLYFNGDGWELYNLKNDPQEQRNLKDKKPRIFQNLERRFEIFKKEITALPLIRKGPALTEEEKGYLKSLGYMQ